MLFFLQRFITVPSVFVPCFFCISDKVFHFFFFAHLTLLSALRHIYWPILSRAPSGWPFIADQTEKSSLPPAAHQPCVLLQPETDRLVSPSPLWLLILMETYEKDTLEIMTRLKGKVSVSLPAYVREMSLPQLLPCVSLSKK